MIGFDKLKRLYKGSPLFVQRLYSAIPFSLRAGRVYRETLKQIHLHDALDEGAIAELQRSALRRLFEHCDRAVPFYRQQFRDRGIRVLDEDPFETLRKLPIVSKADLAARAGEFQAEGCAEAVYKDNTGGSSGTPLSFYKNNSMYPIEIASMNAQWERVGYRPGDPKITLRGRTFSGVTSDRRWVYNPIYNELALSTYHLDKQTLSASMVRVRSFAPKFIHGYPAAIVEFIRVLDEAEIGLPTGIKAAFCGSEPLYEYQRRFIESRLGCRCYSWYGQSECVLLGGECEFSSEYHMLPLYGITELVDDNDQPITTPGVEGEIIGSSLNNYAMPFIRYRTGDRGIFGSGPCKCGRQYTRLARVTGRKQYYVYTANGTAVPVTAFVFGQHFLAFERIRGMQLVQNVPGRLVVRIVREATFSLDDEAEIRHRMQSSVDEGLQIVFEYPESLPTNQAGKVDFVIQNCPPNKTVSHAL